MKDFIDLSKIKVKANQVDIYYEKHVFDEDNDDKEIVNEHNIISRHKPHEDMVNALAMLRKHVIEICELGPSTKPKQIEVKGISLSGLETDDNAKVVIIAQKRMSNNSVFAINTPLTTLIDESKYPLAEDLDKKCAKIRKEALAYLDGKHAPSAQQDLFKSDELTGNMHINEEGVVEGG